jgi:antitoxin (DNA-binding transcriptional repressor) of toxin-antitoxin stability system
MGGIAMKFISVRELRASSARVWAELAGERELVVTNNGRPVAILAAVDGSNLEESLAAFRQARAVEAVARLQRDSLERGGDRLTAKEIDAEIAAVRAKRSR